MSLRTSYILGIILFCNLAGISQDRCGVRSFNSKVSKNLVALKTQTAEIKLPVAVHFHDLENLNSSNPCWVDLADGLIERLNKDFNKRNSELTPDWKFQDLMTSIPAGNSQIAFEIAQHNHPLGSNLADGEKAVTYNLSLELVEELFEDYLNIHIGLYTSLGNSPTGGTGKDGGIYIDVRGTLSGYDCVDGQVSSSYDKGRTITHEVGHYLGLNHIWGQEESCAQDDGIEDTPLMDYINSACEESNSCGSKDMTMNYMGYADDKCMYMFTPMQCSAMRTYILENLQNVINKGPKVLSTISCEPIRNLVINDFQGTISLSWDQHLVDSTYIAYRPKGETDWTEAKVDTNLYQFTNTQYPISYELVMYNSCLSTQSSLISEYNFQEFSLERNSSFFIHDWINLYPNPTNDILNIEVELDTVGQYSNILNVNYWNINGQEQFFRNYVVDPGSSSSKISLDVSHLTTGLYFIRIHISYFIKELVFIKL